MTATSWMQRLKFEALTRFAMRGCIDGRFFSQLPAKATNASQHCNTSKLSHQVSQLFPTSSGKVRRTNSNLLVLSHTKASTDRNETEQGPKIKNFQPYSAQSKTLVIVWGSGACNNYESQTPSTNTCTIPDTDANAQDLPLVPGFHMDHEQHRLQPAKPHLA